MTRMLQILVIVLAIAAGALLAIREHGPLRPRPATPSADPTSVPPVAPVPPAPPPRGSDPGGEVMQIPKPPPAAPSSADLAAGAAALGAELAEWTPRPTDDAAPLLRAIESDPDLAPLAARWRLVEAVRRVAVELVAATPSVVTRMHLANDRTLDARELTATPEGLEVVLLSGITTTLDPAEVEREERLPRTDYLAATRNTYTREITTLENGSPIARLRGIGMALDRADLATATRLFDAWIVAGDVESLGRLVVDDALRAAFATLREATGAAPQGELADGGGDGGSGATPRGGPDSVGDLEKRLDAIARRLRQARDPERLVDDVTLCATWLEDQTALDDATRNRLRRQIQTLLTELLGTTRATGGETP